ncbi:MAG: hypothetical protein DDT29_02374 [Dehalococcoidia bacterium]|nr:hypothetical protein [Bacillota bacterium]
MGDMKATTSEAEIENFKRLANGLDVNVKQPV